MTMKAILYIVGALLGTVFCFSACQKENSETSQLKVKMVDSPSGFQEVNVEILGIEIHTKNHGWINMPTNQGVYNLLNFQDNISAILVDDSSLPSGHVTQMRLILGSNNYVVQKDSIYALNTPSANQSGLKINVDYHFEPNKQYELLFDFDAAQSIINEGNSAYSLKPTLKILSIITL